MARGLDALELLRKDHQRVEQVFRRFERARSEEDPAGLIEEACVALTEHADLEEQYFYPMVLEMTAHEQLVEEAQIEHGSARQLIQELRDGKAEGARRLAVFRVLIEYVRHHVQEEEERIFPLVQKTGVDLEAFGQELAARRTQAPAPGRKAGGRPGATGATRGARREREGARDPEAAGQEMAGEQRARQQQQGSRQRAVPLRRIGKEQRRASGNGDDSVAHAEPSVQDNEACKEASREGLSRTALRAKWINVPDEHEDRPGQSLATRSHEVIRHWAEERRAAPATTPGGDAERPRVLRFNFPGFDKNLQEVSWDAWFGTFDDHDLVFIFQEHMKAGNPSNFFKLDISEREHE
jgi:hemerythrin superfamily protein